MPEMELYNRLPGEFVLERAPWRPYEGDWAAIVQSKVEGEDTSPTLLFIRPGAMTLVQRFPQTRPDLKWAKVTFQLMFYREDDRLHFYAMRLDENPEKPEELFPVYGVSADTLDIDVWDGRATFRRVDDPEMEEMGFPLDSMDALRDMLDDWSAAMEFDDDPKPEAPPRQAGLLKRLWPF